MAESAMMILDCNGAQAWRRGDRLLIGFARTSWPTTTRYVAALVTFIVGANGIAQVALGNGLFGLIAMLVAGGTAWLTVWAHRRVRASDPAPPKKLQIIIDTKEKLLLDGIGTPLIGIGQARAHRRFQLGSSSSKLVVVWPSGAITVARGNPFGSSVDDMQQLLVRAGMN